MTSTYNGPERGINDRGGHVEYNQKQLRLQNGSRMIQRAPSIMEHFLDGATIDTEAVFDQLETGTGTSHAVFVTSATTAGGAAVGVAGATTNNTQEMAGVNVGWACASMALPGAPMTLEVRAKFVGTTEPIDGDFSIGFADAVTYTSGLPFVVGASSLYTTEAPVEFAGFHYSSIPTSGTLFKTTATPLGNYIGIKTNINSVGALAKSTGVAKDSLFHIYRVDLDVAGNSAYYIDDVFVGSVALAVTAATKLTPYINVTGKNSHAHTATVDYVFVGGSLV